MVGNTLDAEDIVQEIFLRVVKGWRRFRRTSSERTWIWSITRNCLREYYRQQKRNRALTMALQEQSIHVRSPNWPPFSPEELLESLQQLSVAQRQAFICRAIRGWSVKDTATLMGWSEGKVRVTLHRALNQLREVLGDE